MKSSVLQSDIKPDDRQIPSWDPSDWRHMVSNQI